MFIMSDRISRLVLGDKTVNRFKNTHVLVVGVGGTGCELLKNITKMHIGSITMLDFDSI